MALTIYGRGVMTVSGRMGVRAGGGKKQGRTDQEQVQEQVAGAVNRTREKRGRSSEQEQIQNSHLLLLPAPAPASCPCFLLLPLSVTVAGAGGELARIFLTTSWSLVRRAAAGQRVWTTSLVAHLCR